MKSLSRAWIAFPAAVRHCEFVSAQSDACAPSQGVRRSDWSRSDGQSGSGVRQVLQLGRCRRRGDDTRNFFVFFLSCSRGTNLELNCNSPSPQNRSTIWGYEIFIERSARLNYGRSTKLKAKAKYCYWECGCTSSTSAKNFKIILNPIFL